MLDDLALVPADMIGKAKDTPIESVVAPHVRLTRRGGRLWGACPFHNDRSPSFVVGGAGPNANTFHCYGCGAHGDPIDFKRRAENMTFKEAVESLVASDFPKAKKVIPLDGDYYKGITAIVHPENQIVAGNRTPPIFNPRQADNPNKRFIHYTPKAVYAYRDRDGNLIGYVIRVEIGDRKLTPLVRYVRLPDRTETWCHLPFKQPRPLYHLDQLAKFPDRPVVLVEGEKCAQIAPQLLPGYIGVTWQGGVNAVDRADWSALRGRHVLCWPDADRQQVKDQRQAERVGAAVGEIIPIKFQPGPRAMGIAAKHLKNHAATVDLIRVGFDPDRKDGWDCADALAEGWTPRQTADWIEARKVRVYPRTDQ